MQTIFLSGPRDLVRYSVAAETVIAKGHMCWYNGTSDKIEPASTFPWTTDLATTQGNFAAVFVGISLEPSRAGSTTPISVDVSPESVYEIDVASATYNMDTTLGPAKVDSDDQFLSQALETAIAAASIARPREIKAGTRLKVTFAPALSTRSSNVNANIG